MSPQYDGEGDPFTLSRAEGVSYEEQMDLLAACVRPLLMFDVDRLLSTVNRADSVGFLTDPTAYREALLGNRLAHQRNFLEAVRSLQGVVREIERDAKQRGTQRHAYAPPPGTDVLVAWNGSDYPGVVLGSHPTQPMVEVRLELGGGESTVVQTTLDRVTVR